MNKADGGSFMNGTGNGLRTVRPYQIFSRVEAPAHAREVSIKLPQRKDLPLLETALLIAAMKSVGARRIFEFGTFLGATTLNLALNSPDDAVVYTFDLPPGAEIEQHPEDVPFTQQHFALEKPEFAGSRVEGKITVLTGNSLTADLSRFRPMDFVFIDGGHDLATVRADTENALKMVRPGGCIAWHDYKNPRYPELSAYLESLPQKLVSVGDTMLAFWFSE
jgi:predicted O-methyltransferase YrrM